MYIVAGEFQVHDLASRQCVRRSHVATWNTTTPRDVILYLQWIDHTTVAIVRYITDPPPHLTRLPSSSSSLNR